MRLQEPTTPRRRIGLTPLIDVVFLLLVFFMLATTFLKYTRVDVATTRAGGSAGTAETAVIVHVSPGFKVSVNGQPMEPVDIVTRLDALKSHGRNRVILVMRQGTAVDDLVRGLTLVRQSTFETIQVVQ